MTSMNYRQPISLQATYTDENGLVVTKQFRSLNQAGRFFTLNVQALKELSLGGTPKLHDKVPSDLKLIRIETLPKPSKEPTSSKSNANEKYHCDLCNKDMKPTSKYSHQPTAPQSNN